ncbi:hypothetical protein FRX31_024618 [Thalictrum thalictroides]|uniref:Uncharacterized protein n=1 Tax=Thalictrum thalictroides TaxID=46969 RepID=A0A7J6VNN0_THATH|nr:hypothetical protein FRX31_024618 [Thalictrum thalictroides]
MGDFDVAIEDGPENNLLDEEIKEDQFINEDRTMKDFFDFDAFEHDLPFLATDISGVHTADVDISMQGDGKLNIND